MIIHKSPALLAIKIIVLELLIELVYLLVGVTVRAVGQQLGYDVQLISPITQLLLLPLQLGVLVYMLARWSGETYEVTKDAIIVRSGIVVRTEKLFTYHTMQSVVVRQSFLERLVGAGTISVFVPTLGTELVFTEVPNPMVFADSIKSSIPGDAASHFLLRK